MKKETLREEWRDVVGYEGCYKVSNLGKVKSLPDPAIKKADPMIDLNNLAPAPPNPSYEELSVQLLDAAIDLNRIERGEISESPKVSVVLSNLGLQDHLPVTGDDLRKVVDPKTIDIYSRVVSQLTTETTRNINDLAAHMQKYVTLTGSNIVAMKEFFLALHRELLAESYTRLEDDAPTLQYMTLCTTRAAR